MFDSIRKYRKWSAAFLIALLLTLQIERVQAQTAADLYTISVPVGAAGIIAQAAAGVSLATVGWIAAGVAVIGVASYYVYNRVKADGSTEQVPVRVIVASRDIANDPNPDLPSGTQTVATVTNYLGLAPANGGIIPYISSNNWDAAGSLTSLAGQRLVNYINSKISVPSSWTLSSVASVNNSYVPSGTGAIGRCPATSSGCVYVAWKTGVANGVGAYFGTSLPAFAASAWNGGTAVSNYSTSLAIPLAVVQQITDCAADSYFDYTLGMCVSNVAQNGNLQDGICRISWGPDGCPAKNPFDPDCGLSGIVLSCGSATKPPSVSITDPQTGSNVTTERPVLPGQGVPGSVNVTETKPNPAAGTTDVAKTTTGAPANTGARPVANGGQQQVYPGTGAQQGTTPVNQVQITNWPQSIAVTGTVTCTNCTNTGGTGGAAPNVTVNPVVNMPERIKIDGEIPSDSPGLPSTTETQNHKSFLDPVKVKFAGFFNFSFPSHSTSCPAIDIQWNAWALNTRNTSNYMCVALEEHRSLVQSLVNFSYLAIAIIIVLGA